MTNSFHIHYERTRYSFKSLTDCKLFKQGLYEAIKADRVNDYLMSAKYDDCQSSDKYKQKIKLPS
jgi:hypothetical protein